MPRKTIKPPSLSPNSIEYLAFSIEALAARVRASNGREDVWRVLGWVGDELERLACDARDIGDEERASEVEAARG